MWWGEQDSNLRTDKEWDLNPPPLTKLGDPRAGRWCGLLNFKPPIGAGQTETVNPVPATMFITSWVDKLSVVTTTPEFVSWETVARSTPGVALRTLATLPEQPLHVMPVMTKLWVRSPMVKRGCRVLSNIA